jgi:hypothetical protein
MSQTRHVKDVVAGQIEYKNVLREYMEYILYIRIY